MEEFVGRSHPARVALCITCLGDVFFRSGYCDCPVAPSAGVAGRVSSGADVLWATSLQRQLHQPARLVAQRKLAIFAAYDYIVVPRGLVQRCFVIFIQISSP